MTDEFLFVYGTLARDGGHDMYQYLTRHADYAGGAVFQGRLYRVAHYPGAVLSLDPADKVLGELYRLRDRQVLFERLDDYEGCGPNDPPPTEFVRRVMTVRRTDGTELKAWIYLFTGEVVMLPRIASGRFTNG